MIDYIIVGQGLAGTVLAYSLKKEGKRILVTEEESMNSASRVAAGIFNPVTGKRMVKTWKANDLFPFLKKFYNEMEGFLGDKFLYELPIYKPFGSIEEQNHWISQSSFEDIQDLVNTSVPPKKYQEFINNPFGGFETLRSGYLNVSKMIALFRLVLTKNEIYIKKKFEYSDIVFYEDYVEWNGIKAKKIIFCEGSQATSNPYFKWLPFVLTKGELLSVKMEGMTVESIINKGVFIMPTANGLHKVGATNLWDFKDNEISSSAKLELTQKLDLITKVPYKVILQETGIRPTVKDRRPLIGLHPEIKTLGIFNGLGTKGVSLAPFYATMFCNFLEKGEDLDREVNIERYIPLYYTL